MKDKKSNKKKKYETGGPLDSIWDWRLGQDIPQPVQTQGYEQPPTVQPMGATQLSDPTQGMQSIMFQPSQQGVGQKVPGAQEKQDKTKAGLQKAAGAARQIGQTLGSIQRAAPALINAMLPDQGYYREDMILPQAYNPYPQGTGSQAIYEDGGTMKKGGYFKRSRKAGKKGNIQVEEYIPEEFMNIQPSVQPAQKQEVKFDFRPKEAPQQIDYNAPKRISYQMYEDIAGMPTAYAPVFSNNYSYREAVQDMSSLPESFNGIPVMRTPYQYSEIFQNFRPNTQAYDWGAYPNQEYQQQPLMYEDGGQLGKSGIHIKPANKGKFTAKAKSHGMGVQEFASRVMSNKEDYPSSTVKQANFAKNASKWKKEYGGYIQGQEVDLTPQEIQQLLDQGYELEF